jgi:hypothetical protein
MQACARRHRSTLRGCSEGHERSPAQSVAHSGASGAAEISQVETICQTNPERQGLRFSRIRGQLPASIASSICPSGIRMALWIRL